MTCVFRWYTNLPVTDKCADLFFKFFFLIKLRKRKSCFSLTQLVYASSSRSCFSLFTNIHWFPLILSRSHASTTKISSHSWLVYSSQLQYLSLNFVLIPKIRVCIHLVENGWNSVSIYSKMDGILFPFSQSIHDYCLVTVFIILLP